jgi:hypothetical protein
VSSPTKSIEQQAYYFGDTPLDATFPFDQTLEAIAYVETGKVKAGKVVVTFD